MRSERTGRLLLLTTALLGALPYACAHGHNETLEVTAVDASAHTEVSIVHSNSTSIGEPSYSQRSEASALLLAHISLMVIAWGAILPIGTGESRRAYAITDNV